MSLRARTFVKLIAPAAALALVAGCSTSPTTALSVNQTSVSESTVLDTTKSCLTGLGIPLEFAGANKVPTINNMLRGVMADQIAKDEGVQITDSQAEQLAQQSLPAEAQGQLNSPECKQMTLGAARFSLLIQQLGQETMMAAVRRLDVVVNPKYGAYDPEQGQIVQDSTGSLSRTIDTYGKTTQIQP